MTLTVADRAIFRRLKALDWDHPLWRALRSEIASRNAARVTHRKAGPGRPKQIDRVRVMTLKADHTAVEIASILKCHVQSVRNILGGRQ